MRENAIYTVTPPDMNLTVNGPAVTILSTDDEFMFDVETIQEHLFKTVPVTIYHCGGNVNEDNLAWVISVMRFSDTVYVDLDTVSELGLVSAIMVEDTDCVFFSKKQIRQDVSKLFNSLKNGYQVFDSLQDYLEAMMQKFN